MFRRIKTAAKIGYDWAFGGADVAVLPGDNAGLNQIAKEAMNRPRINSVITHTEDSTLGKTTQIFSNRLIGKGVITLVCGSQQLKLAIESIHDAVQSCNFSDIEKVTVSCIKGKLSVRCSGHVDIMINMQSSVTTNSLQIDTPGKVEICSENHTFTVDEKLDIKAKNIEIKSAMHAKDTRLKSDHINLKAALNVSTLKVECKSYYATGSLHVENEGTINAESVIIRNDISGTQLTIEASKKIRNFAKIIVSNLVLNTKNLYVSTWAIIDSIEKLIIGSDYIYNRGRITAIVTEIEALHILSILGGTIRGEKILKMNALTNIIALGGVLCSANLVSQCGLYLSLGGLTRSFHNIHQSLLDLDFGVNVPEMPHDIRDITNKTKLLFVALKILRIIYKPIAVLINIVRQIFALIRNGRSVYERYKTYEPDHTYKGTRKYSLSILNTLLDITSMLFSVRAVGEQKEFIANCTKVRENNKHDNPFVSTPAPTWQKTFDGTMKIMPSLFVPVISKNSIASVEGGVQITGSIVNNSMYNKETMLYKYSLNDAPKSRIASVQRATGANILASDNVAAENFDSQNASACMAPIIRPARIQTHPQNTIY